MPGYTIINLSSADSSNQDVQIAGNFTNWQPQEMKYNDSVKRFEYKVDDLIDGSKNGKYNFKFIINGAWCIDQNYSSEFDDSGNENNVILYDYSDDKSASDEYLSKVKDEVSQDNKDEPKTPDPTPYNLSATTTNVPTTSATTAATGILPVTEAPSQNISSAQEGSIHKESEQSTTASKGVTKTEALKESAKGPPTNGSSEFIPLTESKKELPTTTKSIPDPEPIQKAEPPTKTQEPSKDAIKQNTPVKNDEAPALPKPVARPEPPKPTEAPKAIPIVPESSLPITTAATAKNSSSKSSQEGTASDKSANPASFTGAPEVTQSSSTSNGTGSHKDEPSNQLQEQRPSTQPPSSGRDNFPEYSIGFFATILHVITQFFRRWFNVSSE